MKRIVKSLFRTLSSFNEFTIQLPFEYGDLAPVISEETVQFHFDKHHQGYVDKLNAYCEEKGECESLLNLLMGSENKGVYNLAAQIFNHNLYWNNLMPPQANNAPEEGSQIAVLLEDQFGSFDSFKEEFSSAALGHFGSGWVFLNFDGESLAIIEGHDAQVPMEENSLPILTIDVWEHAYYLDYQNNRAKYIEDWFSIVDWTLVDGKVEAVKAFIDPDTFSCGEGECDVSSCSGCCH